MFNIQLGPESGYCIHVAVMLQHVLVALERLHLHSCDVEVQVDSHSEVFDQNGRSKSYSLSNVQDHERVRRPQLGHDKDLRYGLTLNFVQVYKYEKYRYTGT